MGMGTHSRNTDTSTTSLAVRPREAAKLLDISQRTLWDWTRRGLVPCRKIGTGKRQVVLYSRSQLETWLSQQDPSK